MPEQHRASAFQGLTVVAILLFMLPHDAQAYVGPGMATGAVATVLGIVGGFAMLLFGAVWYPIKKFLRFLRHLVRK